MPATPTLLRDADGGTIVVQEGESCNITWTPEDLLGAAILKTNLITLTVTQFDNETAVVINSRNAQSVLDANNGVVSTAGVLTLRLDGSDTISVGTVAAGAKQIHGLEFIWTWNDGVAVRTGKSNPVGYEVQKLVAPT